MPFLHEYLFNIRYRRTVLCDKIRLSSLHFCKRARFLFSNLMPKSVAVIRLSGYPHSIRPALKCESLIVMSCHGLKAMLQSPFGHFPLWRLLGLLEVRLQLEGSCPFFFFFQATPRFRSFGISSVADKEEQ